MGVASLETIKIQITYVPDNATIRTFIQGLVSALRGSHVWAGSKYPSRARSQLKFQDE